MRLRVLTLALWACFLTAGDARGQEAFERVGLRVTSIRPGAEVVVDRGLAAGMERGDPVIFYPRGGGVFEGIVVELEDRTAVVELLDPDRRLDVGTRGELLIPTERFAGLSQETEEVPEHLPWENEDEEYTEGMPLLMEVDPVRPEARTPLFSGRMYILGEQTWTTDGDRSQNFFRLGTDLEYENPFDRGGGLQFGGETNYRSTDFPNIEDADDDDVYLRVDRLSYHEGGTRFDNRRWEAGRFLQHGMPEFGVVDGFEYTHRFGGGSSVGASVGFMPEPDADYHTLDDFQVAGYYRWVTPSERIWFDAGYQKSFHNGDADRDLFVAKAILLPVSGWDFRGTAWIDYYDDSDDEKDETFEVTQVHASASRSWETGNGVNLTYTRLRYPEIDRHEYLEVDDDILDGGGYDRLALRGWRWMDERKRLNARVSGWDGKGESGADFELGIDFEDIILDDSRTSVTGFINNAQFVNGAGVRTSFNRYVTGGIWTIYYELATYNHDGFDEDNDDSVQHRIRASRELNLTSGWNFGGYVETLFTENDDAVSLGFNMQRSF